MMRPILLLLLSSGTGVAAQGLRAHRSLQMSLAEDPEPAQAVPEAAAAAPMSAAAAAASEWLAYAGVGWPARVFGSWLVL